MGLSAPSSEHSVSFLLRSGRAGRYEVFDDFAAGGIASVHLARHITPSGITKVVAVKRLHPHHASDAEVRAALLDEARFVAAIQHPNVVGVLDICDDAGDLFIAMEYVHGVSLARLLSSLPNKTLDIALAASIVADALKGLHAAHEARGPDGKVLHLVHRDVSPQNIIVGVDGVTRVIDFGLAYALGRSQSTQSGVVKGKPSYMSPEQVRGERVTRASDIFSAGVVLWGAITGKKLFQGDIAEATLFQVLTQPITSPTAFVPGLSAKLEAVVMKALQRSPADRFPTALAMARAIEAASPPPMFGAVGECVEEYGADHLAEMARRIRNIEKTPSLPPHPADDGGPTIRTFVPLNLVPADLAAAFAETLDDSPRTSDPGPAAATAPATTARAATPAVAATPAAATPIAAVASLAAVPTAAANRSFALVVGALLTAAGFALGIAALASRPQKAPIAPTTSAGPAAPSPAVESARVDEVSPPAVEASATPAPTYVATPLAAPLATAARPAASAAKRKPDCRDPLDPRCK